MSARLFIRDLNFPPKKRIPFFRMEKRHDALSSVIYNLYGANDNSTAILCVGVLYRNISLT